MLSVCTYVYTVVHYEYMGTGYADIEHFKRENVPNYYRTLHVVVAKDND